MQEHLINPITFLAPNSKDLNEKYPLKHPVSITTLSFNVVHFNIFSNVIQSCSEPSLIFSLSKIID